MIGFFIMLTISFLFEVLLSVRYKKIDVCPCAIIRPARRKVLMRLGWAWRRARRCGEDGVRTRTDALDTEQQ
jgi:hypothetical protein